MNTYDWNTSAFLTSSPRGGEVTYEDLYQAFKERLLKELYVVYEQETDYYGKEHISVTLREYT